MLKRCAVLLLALVCLCGAALAEVYEGQTAALSTVRVQAEQDGDVEAVPVIAGQRVAEGEPLVRLRADKIFAAQDGTVSIVSAEVGDDVSGAVLELAPVERYTVYCTLDKAYQSSETTLIHSGEAVYAKCTADGTHRAVGIVTQVDGEEYRVLTLGGELYVGETVYLYRDADFTATGRVGIGTVVASDTQAYEAEGTLTLLRVSEGDAVERGQLLYAIGGGEIAAPVGGIVASVSCQPGNAVQTNQTVAEIVPDGEIGVEIRVDETDVAKLRVGSAARLVFAGQEEEDAVNGTVVEISAIAESGEYTVRIRPETDAALALGMSVEARID